MLTPYYDKNGITLYHGDCREILPQLDVKVDLLLTDPPYGIDYQSTRRTAWQRKDKIKGDIEFPLWIFDYLPDKAMFIFCRWDNLSGLPKPKSFIVWDKQRHSMGDLAHEYGRQWEAIAFYPQPNHKFVGRPKDVISIPCIPACNLLHPNEKPVALIKTLLVNNVGETVLDPFMGVGSTLLAAKSLNRKCIGIEIEEKYCEIAAKRCSQTVMALPIEPSQKEVKSNGTFFPLLGGIEDNRI